MAKARKRSPARCVQHQTPLPQASSRGWLCTYATWLLPLRVKFPGEVKRQVLGFVVPPRGGGFDPKRIDRGVFGDEMERGEAGGQRGEEGAELLLLAHD